MTHQQEIHASPLKFGNDNAFQLELQRRVKEYFRTTGRRQRDCWQMYLKTAILVASFAVSYVLLVFVAQTWWHGLPLAILLALSAAGIGFNIQQDGSHQTDSNYPRITSCSRIPGGNTFTSGRSTGCWPSSGIFLIISESSEVSGFLLRDALLL